MGEKVATGIGEEGGALLIKDKTWWHVSYAEPDPCEIAPGQTFVEIARKPSEPSD